MNKRQAIEKSFDNTSYIGSHRHSAFEQELRKHGYKIVALKRKPK